MNRGCKLTMRKFIDKWGKRKVIKGEENRKWKETFDWRQSDTKQVKKSQGRAEKNAKNRGIVRTAKTG